jgi:hypothetical protein
MSVVPPYQFINARDKAGLVVVLTTFFLVAIWIAFLIRLYIRLKIRGPWKWDDWFVTGATVSKLQ